MTDLDEVLTLPRGAKFFRADLHVHSFQGSHDVRDTTMTPGNIVKTALQHGLDILSVTDHNEITNVAATIAAAQGTTLLVVPGVELSTPQGHLLAYLPNLQSLERFHGRLDVVERHTPTSRCKNAILDCLDLLDTLGGFGVLAHVDAGSGFETENPGGSPHKVDVICHKALVGIELKSATSEISFAERDPHAERARAGQQRIERLGLGEKQFLARVLFSDSHALSALGRNTAGDKKVTRIKMDNPSFDALRIALEDSDARVRIEELVPNAVPHVLGLRFKGGFLDKQAIHLSHNLNCIIGGRGTGKSTTFEAIACLSGIPSDNNVIDSEVGPGELMLFWRDAAGAAHSLQKLTGEEPANLDDSELGPVTFSMDCYGQGATARLGHRAKTDPLALLQFLDRFVDLKDARKAETLARDALLDLQTKIEKAELQVALIPRYQRELATTQQQLKATQKVKATQVIDLQRKLAAEQEIRARIAQKWREAQDILTSGELRGKIEGIVKVADLAEVEVGAKELRSIIDGAELLDKLIANAGEQVQKEAVKYNTTVHAALRAWKAKEDETKRKIEAKRQELEAQGVRLDMTFIRKLATDEAKYKKSLDELEAWKPHLAQLKRRRAGKLQERWSARSRVAAIRGAYGKVASQRLRSSLSDLKVSLKFVESGSAPDAVDQIRETMGWRTNQVPRASLIIETLTLPKLLEALQNQDTAPLTALSYDDGTKPFNEKDATEILNRLSEPKVRYALERCDVHDLPRLLVTKEVRHDGKNRFVTREFSKLSLGQQQSILLTLLLSSDGCEPLVIDQPEDNLDGEFIYSSFVPVLRRAKERRQIIIVTHNANIAVLGDAEQIVVMKAFGEKAIIAARGSIDSEETRRAACSILEGSEAAFLRRAKIYRIS